MIMNTMLHVLLGKQICILYTLQNSFCISTCVCCLYLYMYASVKPFMVLSFQILQQGDTCLKINALTCPETNHKVCRQVGTPVNNTCKPHCCRLLHITNSGYLLFPWEVGTSSWKIKWFPAFRLGSFRKYGL